MTGCTKAEYLSLTRVERAERRARALGVTPADDRGTSDAGRNYLIQRAKG